MTAHNRFTTATFFVFFSLAFFSCKHKAVSIQRGFYYWKSDEPNFDPKEINCVKTLGVQKLYVKFFEVENNKIFGIRPVSKTSIKFRYESNYEIAKKAQIIPVVFIKTDVLVNMSQAGLDSLADNILFLVSKRYKEDVNFNESFPELQIDCDWTGTTKDSYFSLLRSLKKISHKTISCTLRLYPYKYPEIMGVPPVDKATLMCYNLTNPLDNDNTNSILNVTELKKYLPQKYVYPMQLDIALPINSWVLCFQNHRFTGILRNLGDNIRGIAIPVKPLWYRVAMDTVIEDVYLRQGDALKYEEATQDQLQEAIKVLSDRLSVTPNTTISFFHLDKNTEKKYSNETLDHLYNSFK